MPMPTPGMDTKAEVTEPTQAFAIDYTDGLRVTHVGCQGCDEFAFGVRQGGRASVTLARSRVGERDHHTNFAILSRVVEDWLRRGAVPYPLIRALLTCGLLQAMARTLPRTSGATLDTPHLVALGYVPNAQRSGLDHL